MNNLIIEQMGKVGLNVCLIPIAGVIGTLVYNKVKISRDVLTIVFLLCLALSFVFLPFTQGLMSIIVLLIGSFFLYGPHVFLVSTFPSRFVDEKVVAASTGFIDGMGYVGTVLIGIIVPFIITVSSGEWRNVFWFWGVLSVLVAVFVGITYLMYYKTKNSVFCTK